jgi:hypothetical protein
MAEARRDVLEHAHRRGDDIRPDAIAWQQDDLRLHTPNP